MAEKKADPFDFGNLDTKSAAEGGTVLPLDNPFTNEPLVDSDGKAVTITLLGLDSAKIRGIARKLNDKRMTDIRRGRNTEYDSEIVDAEKAQLYAAATVAWEGIKLDGAVLECNEKNARRLYGDPRFPWLVEQIDRAIADRQRFFKKASPSS